MTIYLVERGPRQSYHRAPFHPVIICTRKHVAKWEAGDSSYRAMVWERESHTMDGGGFLLVRWKGFDVDYGPVVHTVKLPDGTTAGFVHPHTRKKPWCLLRRAVWWSDRPLPQCLADKGVIYPPDEFSRLQILDHTADDCISGCLGARTQPSFWPKAKYRLSYMEKT